MTTITQLSTIFSNVVLAIVVLYGLVQFTDPSLETYAFAVFGYIISWLGSAFGIVRFTIKDPPCPVIRIHRAFTWLGVTVGFALIAAQMYYKAKMDEIGHIHLVSGLLLLLVKLISDYRTSTTLSEFVSAISAVSILMYSVLTQNWFGCLGAMSVIVCGLIVGTRGRRLGMPSVNIFHYGLSIGLYCFMRVLKEGLPEEFGL